MAVVYESWENELAIDAAVVVHNHLYLMEQSILHDTKQRMEPDIEPERVSSSASQPGILCELSKQRLRLQLVCRRVFEYARRTVENGFDRQISIEFVTRAIIRNSKSTRCSDGESEVEVEDDDGDEVDDEDEERPLKMHRPTDPTHQTFQELVNGMKACKLDDMHKNIVNDLKVYDPKRKAIVPCRFCSFHLAGFNLDAESPAALGPPYKPDPANKHNERAAYCTEVISIRVVKAGPDYTYPVEVYGKVIARDEVDYKCVYLFNRQRKDAQTIKSEKDMLALTGPNRALVTLGFMYFEFNLKIKGKGGPDDEVQFSQGVISYYFIGAHKRIIEQLPSFQSTVKLVLQHVPLPVAASLEVSVVNEESNHPLVHFDGKITAGTTRNYRHHMVLYDSSVRSGDLVRENGSLALNRHLVAVNGFARLPPFEEDEELVLYVCFLDASCEIADVDTKIKPEQEDYKDCCFRDASCEIEDKDEILNQQEEEEDPKNAVTLKYPQSEIVWEHGCPKLKVKVDWTVVLDRPEATDFLHRYSRLPQGYSIDYRSGICFDE